MKEFKFILIFLLTICFAVQSFAEDDIVYDDEGYPSFVPPRDPGYTGGSGENTDMGYGFPDEDPDNAEEGTGEVTEGSTDSGSGTSSDTSTTSKKKKNIPCPSGIRDIQTDKCLTGRDASEYKYILRGSNDDAVVVIPNALNTMIEENCYKISPDGTPETCIMAISTVDK